MIFGRLLFGLGGESLGISLNTMIIKWFKDSNLSLAFAINLSIVRTASIFNALFTPRIAEVKIIKFLFSI